jgi:hypothetical protein
VAWQTSTQALEALRADITSPTGNTNSRQAFFLQALRSNEKARIFRLWDWGATFLHRQRVQIPATETRERLLGPISFPRLRHASPHSRKMKSADMSVALPQVAQGPTLWIMLTLQRPPALVSRCTTRGTVMRRERYGQ